MPASPSCPRCGYDLSGVASSWQESCPLDGTCSECGLSLRWAEVLNPILTVPAWSFEHALGARPIWRLAQTWSRALRPGEFWRAMRLEHPVAARRLCAFLLLGILATHLIVYATSFVLWCRMAAMWGWGRRGGGGPFWAGDVAVRCLWPYDLGDAPSALRGDILAINDSQAVTLLHWFFLAWMVFTPLSFLILTDTFRQVRVRYVHLFRAGVYSIAPVPVFVLAHAAVHLFTSVALSTVLAMRFPVDGVSMTVRGAMWLAAAAWFVRYWVIVPRDYLRLPQAGLVSAVMLGLSAFGAFVLILVLMVTHLHFGFW